VIAQHSTAQHSTAQHSTAQQGKFYLAAEGWKVPILGITNFCLPAGSFTCTTTPGIESVPQHEEIAWTILQLGL